MDRDELIKLADKVASGLATNEEVYLYNRVCDSFQQESIEWDDALFGNKSHLEHEIRQSILLKTGIEKPVIKMRRYWMAAASVVLIAIASYFYLNLKNSSSENKDSVATGSITERNESTVSKLISLKDGSKITLSPESFIRYNKDFNDSIREVYLEGEAFFHVAKDPKKPFFVYYDRLVTRVLGTSFTINTNLQTGNLEIAVKTGRVQVYENNKLIKENNSLLSVILTPNQKAVYQVDKRVLTTELVSQPELVKNHEDSVNVQESVLFVYEQTRLLNVFRELEKGYGIEIVVDNTNLNNCVFTGDVSTGDLFTKLKIICLATNSSYEVNGTKILIKGAGCN